MYEPQQPKSFSFFMLIGYAVYSILFIHLLGVFGIFAAFAYPLWWFFFPQKTFCFFCIHSNLTAKNALCPVCKKPAHVLYNPPFYSVLMNMIALLIISFMAFGIVFSEVYIVTRKDFNILSYFTRGRADVAISQQGVFKMGQPFYIDIEIKNPEKPVNIVQTDFTFNPDLLSVDHIDTEKSFATIFVKKDYSNEKGTVSIIGGLPNPGFMGDKGLVARVYFVPKKTGDGQLSFLPSSKIFANDGIGSTLLAKFPDSPIRIREKK